MLWKRHLGDRFSNEFFYRMEFALVLFVDKRYSGTRRFSSCSSSNSVNVVFRIWWHVEIDDEADSFHVDSP